MRIATERSIRKYLEQGLDKKEIRGRGYRGENVDAVFEKWVAEDADIYEIWQLILAESVPIDEIARRSQTPSKVIYAMYRSHEDDKNRVNPVRKSIKKRVYEIFDRTDGSMAALHEFAEKNGVQYHTLYTYRQNWLEERAYRPKVEDVTVQWDKTRLRILSLLATADLSAFRRNKRTTASGMVFDKYTDMDSSWIRSGRGNGK